MAELTQLLLVEDEPDIREIAVLSLVELGGFSVTACASGEEALRSARSSHQLILLDVMMPEMDGTMLLLELRKRPELADTPVVFMTAKAQTHEVEHLKGLGAIGVISKPFDPVRLPAEIRLIWHDAAARRERYQSMVTGLKDQARDTVQDYARQLGVLREALILRRITVEQMNHFLFIAHNLCSLGGSFGFEGISSTAGATQIALIGMHAEQLTADDYPRLLTMLDQLVEVCAPHA